MCVFKMALITLQEMVTLFCLLALLPSEFMRFSQAVKTLRTSSKFINKIPKQLSFNIKCNIGIDWPGL